MKKTSRVSLQPESSSETRGRARSSAARAETVPGAHLREWMTRGLRDLPRDSAVLAIGCEEAFVAPQLTEHAAHVTVLDTCAVQIAQLARRFPEIDFRQHELGGPIPFPAECFDAIWCCEVLDRVFDPVSALREMRRVLVPNGRLLLTVPNHGAVRTLLGALLCEEAPAVPVNPRVHHFSRTSLALLAQDAGLAKIEVSSGGGARRLGGQWLPRSLLLAARKGPGARLIPTAAASVVQETGGLWDELALAGRTLAA